ncbi:hypothetical protein HDU81_007136 [Chytriomyces hyalinus]|nr:hypothetical protein HDU81_007136 [Chytriomyces hyalinus]
MTALTAAYVHSVVIATFFYALACAVSLYGSAMAAYRLMYRRSASTSVMAAILVCNLALLGEILAFEWGVLGVTAAACVVGNTLQNATYHVCMSVFLGFILYKSWVIALKRRVVGLVSAAIVVVRVVFGVWEAATCRGYLSQDGECLFDFSKSVFYAYVSIDVAGDLFATVVAVVSCWMDRSTRLSKVLMAENVARSGISLVQSVVYIWASQYPSTFTFANGIQMVIIAMLLNSEFMLIEARSAAYLESKHGPTVIQME